MDKLGGVHMSRNYNTPYVFREEYCFNRQEGNDRLEKQLGDFGEQLVITILGRMKKYRVAYVDHEGADLIASDDKDRRYAISVKTRQMGRYKEKNRPGEYRYESNTISFAKSDQIKLCKFAEDFNLIPVVAFVIVAVDFSFVDVYMVALEDFFALANAGDYIKETTGKSTDPMHKFPERAISKNDNEDLVMNNRVFDEPTETYLDNDPYMDYLQNNPYIKHLRLDLNGRLDASPIESEGIHVPYYDGPSKCDQLLEDASDEDGNLKRQFGDFGENLVSYVASQLKGYKVAIVDHVGIDIIATKPVTGTETEKRYGVSVKAHNIRRKADGKRENCNHKYEERVLVKRDKNKENEGKEKYERELSKIKEFCDSFGLIPAVAYVFVEKMGAYSYIDVYILTLENLLKIGAEGETRAISINPVKDKSKHLINLSNMSELVKSVTFSVAGTNSRYLQNHPNIEHISFKFDLSKIDPNRDW